MTQPTIDPATFAELQETAGAEFVHELVDTFFAEAPLMLEDLRSALAAQRCRPLSARRPFAQVEQQHFRRADAGRDGAGA